MFGLSLHLLYSNYGVVDICINFMQKPAKISELVSLGTITLRLKFYNVNYKMPMTIFLHADKRHLTEKHILTTCKLFPMIPSSIFLE